MCDVSEGLIICILLSFMPLGILGGILAGEFLTRPLDFMKVFKEVRRKSLKEQENIKNKGRDAMNSWVQIVKRQADQCPEYDDDHIKKDMIIVYALYVECICSGINMKYPFEEIEMEEGKENF